MEEYEKQLEIEERERSQRMKEIERAKADEKRKEEQRLADEAALEVAKKEQLEKDRLQRIELEKQKKEQKTREVAERRRKQIQEAELKAEMIAREIQLANELRKKEEEAARFGITTRTPSASMVGIKNVAAPAPRKSIWQMDSQEKETLLQEAEMKIEQTKRLFEQFQKERREETTAASDEGYTDVSPAVSNEVPGENPDVNVSQITDLSKSDSDSDSDDRIDISGIVDAGEDEVQVSEAEVVNGPNVSSMLESMERTAGGYMDISPIASHVKAVRVLTPSGNSNPEIQASGPTVSADVL